MPTAVQRSFQTGTKFKVQRVIGQSQPAPGDHGWTIEAQFAPTSLTNLIAFMDSTPALSPAAWTRQAALPYPTNGGWMKVPWTNAPEYFRFGFSTQ